ncbi:MAG TPA: hypothetical protein VFX58_12455 [Chitinophagaceae bacterium]|nr:hypothetical protein [Chitinophagaceae bacterium]
MRKITRGILSITFFLSLCLNGLTQVTVSGGTAAAGPYTTLAAAVNAINGTAVTGPITVDVIAGHTETLTAIISLTATGTAANPIVFQKSGGGANPLITAYTGGTATQQSINNPLDGLFRLVGSDYITINGIDLRENPVNTGNARMEYGYALLKANDVDGCQHNTIQNCTITLDRTNTLAGSAGESDNGSTGIWVANTPVNGNVLQVVSSPDGTNSFNRFYSNTLQNCNTGIYLRGYPANPPYNLYDQNNDVGGTSPATGNTIINFGGGGVAEAAHGIRGFYQNGFNFSYNTIQNNNGGGINHTGELRGVRMQDAFEASGTINNNTITLTGAATGAPLTCIENNAGADGGGNTININDNLIQNCTYTTATAANFTGIVNSAAAGTIHVNGNTINNNSLAGTGSFTGIIGLTGAVSASSDVSMNNNTVTGNTKTGASGPMYCIRCGTSSMTMNNNNLHDNSITANAGAASSNLYGLYSDDDPEGESFNNNTIYNFSIAGASTSTTTVLYGIYTSSNAISNKSINGNTIYNLQYTNSSTGACTVAGIHQAFTNTCTISRNKIYELTASGSENSKVYGMNIGSGITVNISNNLIGNLSNAAANSEEAISGMRFFSSLPSSTINASYNSIYLNASSGGTNFGTSGITHTSNATSTTSQLNLRNNIVVNTSTPAGTGLTVAYRRTGTELNNYGAVSNNNLFYAGTPSPNHLVFHDGSSGDQFIDDFKLRVAPRDAASVSENPPFLSTTGSNTNFLHLDPTIFTQAGNGGIPVTGITVDFDGEARSGTTPDIGADEFAGTNIDLNGPAISFSPIANSCVTGARMITAIITDPSGVPVAGIGLPRVYWRINAGGYTFSTGTSLGGGQYQFSIGTGSASGDVVSYYFVAQDNAGTPNVRCLPSAGATGFSANPPNVSTAPTTPFSYTVITSLNGTYTVGAGGVYPTLTAAISDYNSKCLSGPVIFQLINTSYGPSETFPLNIVANPDASAVNTLTIRPAPATAVTISGISGGSASALFRFNGADHITIDGINTGGASLLIENSSAAEGTAVIWISSNGPGNGAHDNRILNTVLKGGISQAGSNGNTFGILVAGSVISSSFGSILGGDDNDNTIIQGNSFLKLRYGIYTRGGSTSNPNTGTQVLNNIIGPASAGTDIIGQNGLLSREEDGIQVSGNEIRFIGANYAGTTLGSDRIGIAFSEDGTHPATAVMVKNALVNRNRIHDLVDERTFSAIGIMIAAAEGANPTNNVIANNMIYDVRSNGTGSDGTIGIEAMAGNTDKFVYNTIYLTGDTDPDPSATAPDQSGFGLAITATTVSNPLLRNNLLYMNLSSSSNPTLKHASISIPNPFSWPWGSGNSDYNDLYFNNANTQANLGNTAGSGGLFYTTLNGWQNAVLQDGFSISLAPVFISSTDLHLSASGNSGINAKATPIPGITTDFDSETRDGSNPDIGCDEFSPAASVVDMSATALVAPASSGCYGAAETVTVSVTNNSGSLIDFTLSNVTVNVSVSGAIVYNSNTVLNSGSLAAGASMNVSMPATIDMSNNGVYTFNANTSAPGDINTGNDAMAPVNRNVSVALAGIAGGGAVTRTLTVSGPTLFAEAISCNLIAKLVPGGGSPVAGSTTAKVWIENSVPYHGNNPYVARHYEVTTISNPGSSTGNLTLYFTQAEFDAFNTATGSILDLPTAAGDAAGKANLRVIRYPGTSNDGSGQPSSYSGIPEMIDPADNNISWNATANRWEISIDVTGFSGFIISTSTMLNLCPGSGFVIPAGVAGVTYQWQVNTGTGFANISDGVNYAGTNSANLSLMALPTSFTGYQYRSLVNGVPSPVSYQIKFLLEWQGTVDNNWHNPLNWGGCAVIPDQYTDVVIPTAKPRYPIVGANGEAKSLRAAPGSSVTVNSGFVLNIMGQ